MKKTMPNNILAFDKLPENIQSKLIELQTPGEDRFVFIPRLSKFYYLAIAAGIAWCVYMFASTQNYLWEGWMFALFAAGSLVFISLALFALYKIAASKLAKLKDGFIFTTDECIYTNGNRVEFWNLKELEGFQFREDIKTIEIWIGERLQKIKAENADDAQRLEQLFIEWRNQAGNGFLSASAQPATAYSGSTKTAATVAGVIALLAVSFGFSYAARSMNRDHDDELTWGRVRNGATIGDFEEYTRRHPNGIYKAEVERKTSEIYNRLKDDYVGKVKKSADENAVNALSQLLETVGKAPNRTIYVKVSERRELDDAVVKRMRELTGFDINTYDYSIPPAEEKFRREKLTQDLGVMFLPATRNASINFELSNNPPADAATIDLNYVARSVENYYRFYWFSNGSMTTFYNPAAKIEFDLTMKSPDGRELYKTTYNSEYTNLRGTGLFDRRDAANYSFDKMYFSSVSQDLCNYLGQQFGFTE